MTVENDEQWGASTNYFPMVMYLRTLPPEALPLEQFRQSGYAFLRECCDYCPPNAFAPEARHALAVADRFAAGQATEEELDEAFRQTRAELRSIREDENEERASRVIRGCASQLALDAMNALCAQNADGVYASMKNLSYTVQLMLPVAADTDGYDSPQQKSEQFPEAAADWLRDIFGLHPHQPRPAMRVEWVHNQDGAVRKIADTIADGSKPLVELPHMIDALQDAGCRDETIFEACSVSLPHTKRNWVVRAVQEATAQSQRE